MKGLWTAFVIGGLFVPSFVFAAAQPNDPYLHLQWYLDQIHAKDAWEVSTGTQEVIVAVIDSGVDIDHPDLLGNTYTNPLEVPGDRIDNDRNGYIDDVNGWDFFSGDNNPRPNVASDPVDGTHHGTAVAGIIGAAGDNMEGIAGVNWNVRILPVRVLSSEGEGTFNDIVDAIDYSVAMGADVINMSFVGNFSSHALDQALQRAYDANVVVVAAAGNSENGVDLDQSPLYPVCSQGTGRDDVVIGVVATMQNDERAPFSNYGADCADIAAPGILMMTTQVETDELEAYGDNWHGTSFSAPLIAGSAALIRSAFPETTVEEVRSILQLTVDPVKGSAPSGTSGALGTGRVNIGRAFERLPEYLGREAVSGEEETEGEFLPVPLPVVEAEEELLLPLVFAAGAGDAPRVQTVTIDGDTRTWLAYGEGFRGGVRTTMDDLNSDDAWEVVTVPGPSGGPHVKIFDSNGSLFSEFFAYGATFSGGLDVTLTDVDRDGEEEIVVVSGDAGLPIRIFEYDGRLVRELAVDHGFDVPRIEASDLSGDGIDELILSSGTGPEVAVQIYTLEGAEWNQFSAYAQGMHSGVDITVLERQGQPMVVTGVGNGGGPHVRIFSRIGALVSQFFAYESDQREGVQLASWRPFADTLEYIVTVSLVDGLPEVRVFDTVGNPVDLTIPLSGFTNHVTISS